VLTHSSLSLQNSTKDSYESAVRSEKSDGSGTPNSPEIVYSSEENIRASSPNDPGKQTFFEDGNQSRPVLQGLNTSYEGPQNDRQRRRRSSLQTKLDRHRRKKMEYINQRSLDSGMMCSESQSDLTNDSLAEASGQWQRGRGRHRRPQPRGVFPAREAPLLVEHLRARQFQEQVRPSPFNSNRLRV